MRTGPATIWTILSLIMTIPICTAFILGNTKSSRTIQVIHPADSSIVYHSYDSGEIIVTFIPNEDQYTAKSGKSDILIIGQVLDSEKNHHTTIDTLDDNWFNQTNYQSYTYRIKVSSVEFGFCSKNFLEITVTSSSSHKFRTRYSHLAENGDSVYETDIINATTCCGHLINKQIPVGEECIFHFKKGDLRIVDYISGYSIDDLREYRINSGLETEH